MTIDEFARGIGVSPTTVSRAIHGRGRVSPATRRMVIERMEEFGFTPNVNAQRLSHGRTNLIALDFGPWHDYLADMFFVELTRSIQEALEERGYGVLLSGPGEVLHRWIKTSAVDGAILIGEPPDASVPQEISSTGTPCVVIGNRAVTGIDRVGSVMVGLKTGARQVAQLLLDRGHRCIGYIGEGNNKDALLREFRIELENRGATLDDSRVIQAGHNPKDGTRALLELLALEYPPTAVFARTDGLAAGAVRAAHKLGVRVPKDLSIVGHDDVPFAELIEPPLTTVRVDCDRLAQAAAAMLFSLLTEPHVQPELVVVDTELVVRESVSVPRSNIRMASVADTSLISR